MMNNEELKTVGGKILRGALISACGAAALYVLDAIGKIDFGSAWTPLVAAIIPIIVNAVKSWIAGQKLAAKRIAAQK